MKPEEKLVVDTGMRGQKGVPNDIHISGQKLGF